MKAVNEIYSPVSGEVVEVNGELKDAPEKINADPHGAGWLVRVRLKNPVGDGRADGRSQLTRTYRRAAREGSFALMRYLPKSPAERAEMLAAIGVESIDDLFSSIPERFRLREALKLPGPYSEAEIIQYFKDRAKENSAGYTSFLGAGVYNHLRSVVTDTIIQRGEFLTSYTPYQAEISQGTLQAIFEFQTLDLPAHRTRSRERLDVGWFDGHDGSRAHGRKNHSPPARPGGSFLASGISRTCSRTYAKNFGLRVEEIPFGTDGALDRTVLESAIRDDVAAVVVQSPNFFGVIESGPGIGGTAFIRQGRCWSWP